MKDFFKTVLNGIKISLVGLSGFMSYFVSLYFIAQVHRAVGWLSILLLLLGIVFILLSVGVYWCIGESIFDKNIDIKE